MTGSSEIVLRPVSADERWMELALMLAGRGVGTTAPNPSVGAVIVDPATGEVVGRGWTQPGGRPHAEVEALRRAGPRARGATLYVTLEPCSHFGRTSPCADAVVEAGIARCVVGIRDPDPRVSGRGLRRCAEAGVAVVSGVLAEQARQVTLGHILRVTERRPFVLVKMALGSDGSIARGRSGVPVWVTGPQARADGHLLRAEADAILVGAGTVADDDPDLTCRLPGLTHQSPIRVVLAGGTLPKPSSRVVATAGRQPTWIVHGPAAPAGERAALEAAGCRLFETTIVDGRVWLPAVMETMVGEGITRMLVEGGPHVWRSFLSSGLADEVCVYRAASNAPAGPIDIEGEVAKIGGSALYQVVESRWIGADRRHVLRRK